MKACSGLWIAMAMVLASCGGSGGSQDGAAPNPTATVRPTNSALSDLQADQTFSTTAFRASQAAVLGNNSTAASAAVELRYVASTRTYTVDDGAGTFAFGPGDISAADGGPGVTAYRRTNGEVRDTLWLWRSGQPATYPTYYAGAGLLFSDSAALNSAARGIAFTYGFATAQTSIPTSGSRRYVADLRTASSMGGSGSRLEESTGVGDVQVDFAARQVTFSITSPGEPTGVAGLSYVLTGSGPLAADGTFSGVLKCLNCTDANSQFSGRLYGPNAEEIAFSYRARAESTFTSSNTGASVGAVTGRQSTQLSYSRTESFLGWSGGGGYEISSEIAGDFPANRFIGGIGDFIYEAPTDAYIITQNRYFPGSARIAAESTSQYELYRFTPATVARSEELRVYRIGSTEVPVDLQYSGVLRLKTLQDFVFSQSRGDAVFHYGKRTPQTAVPAVGTARYRGIAYGLAVRGFREYVRPVDIRSEVELTIDFAARTFSGTVTLTGTERETGATVSIVSYPASGSIDASGRLTSNLPGYVFPPFPPSAIYSGGLNGVLYGPSGTELGMEFRYTICTTSCVYGGENSQQRNATGIMLLKRVG